MKKTRFRPRKNEKKAITVKKKGRKHALDQESKIQDKTITTKKKEGRKWKTHFFYIYSIWSKQQMTETILVVQSKID